jgi:glycosyltransferase involved in cell wall biosynthesis
MASVRAGPPANSGSQSAAPYLSIGLPVFNGERYLNECIESIVRQSFRDFELIICDNASTDATHLIALEWSRRDSRIRVHRTVKNLGAAPNFNSAFQLSRGEFFKWCAADDLLVDTHFRTCLDLLQANPDAVLAYPGTLDIDTVGNSLGERHDAGVERTGDAKEWNLRFREMIFSSHSCVSVFGIIRSAALRKSSLIGSYVGSDRVLLAELSLMGTFVRSPENLFLHREHDGRSVRGELTDRRQRSAWFDTSSKGRAFPSWRFLREYSRVALQADLPIKDRLLCVLEVGRWLRWGYAKQLVQDITYHLRVNRAA